MPLRGTTPDENGEQGANPLSGAVGVFRSRETGAASPSTSLTRAPRGTTPCRSPAGEARVADSLPSVFRRAVITHGRQCLAVGREEEGIDRIRVPSEGHPELAARHVPEP